MAGKKVRLAALGVASAMALVASPAAVSAKGYAALDKLPDWTSTIWYPDWSKLFKDRKPGAGKPKGPPYTAAAAKMVADYNAKKKEGEDLQSSDANCLPPGMPRIMQMPYPFEFLYSPGRITILTEAYMQVRRIYMNQPLPEDPDPAFNGHSVGHWEGNTLIVDTIGLDKETTLLPGTDLHPTDKTRISERIQRPTPDTLVDDMVITDPTLFTEPYTTSITYVAKPKWHIREYICEENNHDASDPFGRPSMSLKDNPKD